MKRAAAQTIRRRLHEELGIDVDVEEIDGGLRISGAVDSADSWQLVQDFVTDSAPGLPLDNRLTVEPSSAIPETGELDEAAELLGREEALEMIEERLSADFADHHAEPRFAAGVEEVDATIAPYDPVVERGHIVGGFQLSAVDQMEVEASAADDLPGDEALAEAIRHELEEDSSTNALAAEVWVENRVAHLAGQVAGPEDIENAEAVARRVPGVTDVIEEFTLSA